MPKKQWKKSGTDRWTSDMRILNIARSVSRKGKPFHNVIVRYKPKFADKGRGFMKEFSNYIDARDYAMNYMKKNPKG